MASRIAAVRETLEETSHDLGDPLNLGYVGHWVTPAVEDRRFDTRFYAAVVSEDHHVRENSGESDADRWLRRQMHLRIGRWEHVDAPADRCVAGRLRALAARAPPRKKAIDELAARTIIPLMPSPTADPTDPSGVSLAIGGLPNGRRGHRHPWTARRFGIWRDSYALDGN